MDESAEPLAKSFQLISIFLSLPLRLIKPWTVRPQQKQQKALVEVSFTKHHNISQGALVIDRFFSADM